MVSDFEAGK